MSGDITLTEALERGLLVVAGGHWETGDERAVVWREPGRALEWRWALKSKERRREHGQTHGGSGTLKSALWAIAMVDSY